MNFFSGFQMETFCIHRRYFLYSFCYLIEDTGCAQSMMLSRFLAQQILWQISNEMPICCAVSVLNSLDLTCAFCSIARANATALISKPKSQRLAVRKNKAVSVRALVDIEDGLDAATGLWDYLGKLLSLSRLQKKNTSSL